MSSESDNDDIEMLATYGGAEAKSIKVEPRPKITPNPRSGSIQSTIGLSPAGYTPTIHNAEKYGSRGHSGDVVFRYKCKDSEAWDTRNSHPTSVIVSVEPPSAGISSKNFKYMFQKTKEISLAMDYVVQDMGSLICEELESGKSREDSTTSVNFCSRPSLQDFSTEDACYIGRIRSDGKITTNSVFFEGCLEESNGHIVSLDLSAVEEFHVFPGQVVALEGKNEMGKCIRVNKVHVPSLPTLQELPTNFERLRILVAAGPFTTEDSVHYEPLSDLMSVIEKDEPDVCILLGPFMEATHKRCTEPNTEETFEEHFQRLFTKLIEKVPSNTKIVIVPNSKDVTAEFVYPTPPYEINGPRLTVVSDPAVISVNGLTIGLSSTDILKHLSQNELSFFTISGDRMSRLARDLLTQRSFYPLYPPEESVPFDAELYVRHGRFETRPHILILPSDLNHFVKDVDGTIVVNPRRLGSSGLSYSRLVVDLPENDGERKLSSVSDFCVGEIVKI